MDKDIYDKNQLLLIINLLFLNTVAGSWEHMGENGRITLSPIKKQKLGPRLYRHIHIHKRGNGRYKDAKNAHLYKPSKILNLEKIVQAAFSRADPSAGYCVNDSSIIVSYGYVDLQGLHMDTNPNDRLPGDTGEAVMNFSFIFATHPNTFLIKYDKVIDDLGNVTGYIAKKLPIEQGSVCFFRGDMWHSGAWSCPSQNSQIHFRLHSHIDTRSYHHNKGDVFIPKYEEDDLFDFTVVPKGYVPWHVVKARKKLQEQ